MLNDTSSIKTSGMSNGQLKGFAVESLIRESGADFSSKELKDVSRKNRNLALKATSVAESAGLCLLLSPFCPLCASA
jgi:hypothetical protein